MTEWIVTHWNGSKYHLPQPLAWKLAYGLGSPCDSFWVETLWERGQEEKLAGCVRLTVKEDGAVRFVGVVDECRCQWSQEGQTAELSGRGMQALLLDNQAEAADYTLLTLGQLMQKYVTPYGITLDKATALPEVWGFSVTSGSSCWKVVYEFARYYAGVTPRFDRAGHLCLGNWADGTPTAVEDLGPVTEVVFQENRYGVLSQVTVKDSTGWTSQTETNQDFVKRGGQCSRVIQMPKTTGYQARRYNAQFQLARSAAEEKQIQVTVAASFAAWPGDLVSLTQMGEGLNGTYRVQEATVTLDESGCATTLVLGDRNAVL
jgi:prophage tail gpP-like protein